MTVLVFSSVNGFVYFDRSSEVLLEPSMLASYAVQDDLQDSQEVHYDEPHDLEKAKPDDLQDLEKVKRDAEPRSPHGNSFSSSHSGYNAQKKPHKSLIGNRKFKAFGGGLKFGKLNF